MKKIILLYVLLITLVLTPVVFAASNLILATDASSKVGVGTSSPTSKLDVNGTIRAEEFCIGSKCITSWVQLTY